jgi:glutamate N-acetyltransferase/amino-acid N-acetyltransferase
MPDARAIVINSGNANACTGELGKANNRKMADTVAAALGSPTRAVDAQQVFVLSTGVIGVPMPIDKVTDGIARLVPQLESGEQSFLDAAGAILTTDKGRKVASVSVPIGDRSYSIAAMAKGAGMIGPNMATMLGIVTTDFPVPRSWGQKIVQRAVDRSFNRISVEGHTSTNDAFILLARHDETAAAELSEDDLNVFRDALEVLCMELAKKIPTDGEGAGHLIEIQIQGAATDADADRIARTIASSNLVKTAVAGADPNWGRIVSAAGYAGVPIVIEQMSLCINGISVFKEGAPDQFDKQLAIRSIRDQMLTKIDLRVGGGEGQAEHWTSDLTVDYVRLNAEYTT